ncbi:cell division topological specificity factor MinE [Butyrivibrio sp. INlla16]|uniref:cell division topological specificity factor MinE n=1 Tax=Butyrivibrio sp. INlla16 TaxID=1520807 RepID=UPI00087F74E5|nr:cell division topological specificity factor MinE [Butyrivibrio sp. INlla16]SDB39062.1 cell division topological specificity factor [Butyrivibrio sp. INlla16]
MNLTDVFKKKTSGQAARDRLKLVLVSDRQNCSPEIMDRIKNDIIEVLSKYVEVDKEGLDIKFTQMDTEGTGDEKKCVPALYANIPIKNIKHQVKV